MKKIFKIIVLTLMTFILFLVTTTINKSEDLNEIIEEEPTNETVHNIQQEYPNTDIVGIISIPNTAINEPVVQYTDNDYYLNHDIYRAKNVIGSIYLDYRVNIDDSKKIIIFGHNSKTLNPPFKELEKYYNEEFTRNNREIKIITNQGEHIYEIFSVYIDATDFLYMNIEFNNDEKWQEHLDYLKNKSMFKLDTDLNVDDRILIIQTCSFHPDFKNYKDKYIIIAAKQIN